jgi:hypothetical protein
MAKVTSATPTTMLRLIDSAVSTVRWIISSRTMRRSANGMTIALKPKASSAVR